MNFDPRAYWEKRLAADPTLGGVGYITLGEGFNRWMYAVRREVTMRMMRRLVPDPANASVLDVGSGTGFYIGLWKELGFARVDGSDLTGVVVQRLRAQHADLRIERWEAGAEDPPFLPGYDALSCFDVLFHIVDEDRMRRALLQFHDLLKPGGVLLISDNFVHRPITSPAHMVSRTLEQYRAMLAAAGFTILHRRPMFVLMNYPADSRSPLLHRWWGWVQRRCSSGPEKGQRLGRRLFPLERLLVRLLPSGPSTEIMACRRDA